MKMTAMAVLLLVQSQMAWAGDFLKELKGTYVELFTQETCLNPEYDGLWKSEATKYVGEEKVGAAIQKLVGGCQGTRIGEDAVAYFKQHEGMQFCCAFQQACLLESSKKSNKFKILTRREDSLKRLSN